MSDGEKRAQQLGLFQYRYGWNGTEYDTGYRVCDVHALLERASEMDLTHGWSGRMEYPAGGGIREGKSVTKCLMLPLPEKSPSAEDFVTAFLAWTEGDGIGCVVPYRGKAPTQLGTLMEMAKKIRFKKEYQKWEK